MPPATVGSGLQQQGSFTLGAGEHGGVSVRIESSNASVALVSPDASTPGTAFIDVPVADGSRTAYFHVQGGGHRFGHDHRIGNRFYRRHRYHRNCTAGGQTGRAADHQHDLVAGRPVLCARGHTQCR